MATAQAQPTSAGAPHPAAAKTEPGVGLEPVQVLAPAPQPQQDEKEPVFDAAIRKLPVDLGVSVPVRNFRVRQLLALTPGHVIETQWSHGDDLPLAAGDVLLAWSEFEVVETRLAVRVTRLA